MTDKQVAERRMDEAIDRAVRDIMNVEPRSDLRARVLAELDGPPTRLAFWPRLAFGGVALALVAVLVAILMPRPTERPDAGRNADKQPSPTSSAPSPTPVPAPHVSNPKPDAPSRGEIRQTTRPGIVVPDRPRVESDRLIQAASIDTLDVADTGGTAALRTPGALQPIDPIQISSMGDIGTSTPTIVINPIAVDQIDITPLTPRR